MDPMDVMLTRVLRRRRRAWSRLALGLALGLGLGVGSVAPPPAQAASAVVSSCDEASLRTAITAAGGGGTVTFGCEGTIGLGAPLQITAGLTLDARGHAVTLSGRGAVRVLQVASGVSLTLIHLTVANGRAYQGAGIENDGGTVTIEQSVVTGNVAQGAPGDPGQPGSAGSPGQPGNAGFLCSQDGTGGTGGTGQDAPIAYASAMNAAGGGIYNDGGTITLIQSTLSNNVAQGGDGGVGGVAGAGGGGGIGDQCGATLFDGGRGGQGGSSTGQDGATGFGGAIYSRGGSIVIRSSTLSGNQAQGGAGGAGGPGGAGGSGADGLRPIDLSLYGNGGPGGNGGPSIGGPGGSGQGGGLYLTGQGTTQIINSTAFGNTAVGGQGGAGGPGGAYGAGGNGGGFGTCTNSTGTTCVPPESPGKGGAGTGGAFYVDSGTLRTTNVTIAGNGARGGAGGGGGPAGGCPSSCYDHYQVSMDGSWTLGTTGQSVAGGGGAAGGGNTAGVATIVNTIVATPTGGTNCVTPLSDGGHNLQYPGTACGPSITAADPKLDAALADNGGGLAQTLALQAGSPAIDAADPAACPSSDERPASRVGTCDIGAYEYNGAVPLFFTWFGAGGLLAPPPTIVAGGQITLTVSLGNPLPYGLSGVRMAASLPSGLHALGPSGTTCAGGTLAVSGTALGLSGATLGPGASCLITATVGSTTPGSYSVSVTAFGSDQSGQQLHTPYVGPALTVTVGPPAGFAITPAASGAYKGYPLTVAVQAIDAVGNRVTSYRGTVRIDSSDRAVLRPQDYTFTALDSGLHVFTATLNTGGAQRLTVTDTGTPTLSSSVTVGVGDPAYTACAESNVRAALASGQEVIFHADCTLTLSGGPLAITRTATLEGQGHTVTLDAGGTSGVITVQAGALLSLRNVTVRGGTTASGGGVANSGGTVYIERATLTGNTTTGGAGGGLASSGGLVTLIDSTLAQNRAGTDTGSRTGGNGGGIAVSGGTLLVRGSTLRGNAAGAGGQGRDALPSFGYGPPVPPQAGGTGGDGGAIANTGATVSIVNSTITSNTAGAGGTGGSGLGVTGGGAGGNGGNGGGISTSAGTTTVQNSTLYDNSPGGWGAGGSGTTAGADGASGSGGAVYKGSGSLTVASTIVAGPGNVFASFATCPIDAAHGPSDGGDNLEYPVSTCGFSNHAQSGDPKLAALAATGGPTETLLPQAGSAAIDTGNDAACPATDQRGVVRPVGAHCDIGAVEAGVRTLNDTDSGITYTGSGWYHSTGRGKGDYQDDVHATATAGDSFSYSWTGTGITYIAEKSADEGTVAIYLDGAYKGTVTCQVAAYNVPQQVIYNVNGLPAGSHTLKVVNQTPNYWLLLDALTIRSQ